MTICGSLVSRRLGSCGIPPTPLELDNLLLLLPSVGSSCDDDVEAARSAICAESLLFRSRVGPG